MSNLNQFYTKLANAKGNRNSSSDGQNDFIFAFQQEYQFNVTIKLDAGDTPSRLMSRFFTDASKSAGVKFNESEIFDLSIRSITLPNMSVDAGGEEVHNDFGKIMVPSKGTIIPDQNVFTIQFLNTQKSFCEYFIYPWILETKSNVWVYDTVPFTRADIKVQFEQQDGAIGTFEYVFHGAYPVAFDTINPSHDAESNFERAAVFHFNWMEVVHGSEVFNTGTADSQGIRGLENKHIQIIGS